MRSIRHEAVPPLLPRTDRLLERFGWGREVWLPLNGSDPPGIPEKDQRAYTYRTYREREGDFVRENYHYIADFTEFKQGKWRNSFVSLMGEKNEKDMAQNAQMNATLMKRSAKDLRAKSKTVFIIGAGPSTIRWRNGLARLQRATVIAVNGGILSAPKADYFFSIDWLGSEKWFSPWVKPERNIGIFAGYVPYWITKKLWKERYWFNIHNFGVITDTTNKMSPIDLLQLVSAISGITTLLHLVYYMGFERIVLCGCEQSWDADEFHVGDKESLKDAYVYHTRDGARCSVETYRGFALAALAISIAIYILSMRAKIPVFIPKFKRKDGNWGIGLLTLWTHVGRMEDFLARFDD